MAVTHTALLESGQVKGPQPGSKVKIPEMEKLFSPLNTVRNEEIKSRVKITFHEC